MYLPAIPGMAESLNAQISTIQNSLSIFLLAFGFGMLFFGPLADKYGRRPLALFGLAGFGLASLGLSLSPTAGAFLFFRFFQGLLGSAAIVVIPAMIRDCFGKDTAKGMSTVTMIMLTAPLIAPLIGSGLLIFSDWRAIFLSLTGYSLVVFLLTLWKLPETLSTESKTQQRSFLKNYLHIFTTPRIYPFLATFLMSSVTFFTYLISAPFVYITWFGMTELQFAFIFSTTAVSLIVANFINVRHVSRQGPRNMMYFGLASGSLFSLTLLLVTLANLNMFLTAACFFMIIGSLAIISVNAESLILIEVPNQASTASAVTRTLRFSIGALVGPILAVIYTGTPVPIAILMVIGPCLAALLQLATFMQAKKSRG